MSLNTMHHHRKMVEVRDNGGRDWDREYRLTRDTIKKLKDKDKKAAVA